MGSEVGLASSSRTKDPGEYKVTLSDKNVTFLSIQITPGNTGAVGDHRFGYVYRSNETNGTIDIGISNDSSGLQNEQFYICVIYYLNSNNVRNILPKA